MDTIIMDTIILPDGRTTKIPSKLAYERQYEVRTDRGSEWRMKFAGFEFVWRANCWMRL